MLFHYLSSGICTIGWVFILRGKDRRTVGPSLPLNHVYVEIESVVMMKTVFEIGMDLSNLPLLSFSSESSEGLLILLMFVIYKRRKPKFIGTCYSIKTKIVFVQNQLILENHKCKYYLNSAPSNLIVFCLNLSLSRG